MELEMNCPKCGHKLIKKETDYGIFYGCSQWPKCSYTKSLDKVEVRKNKINFIVNFIKELLDMDIEDFLLSCNWSKDFSLYLRIFLQNFTLEDIKYVNMKLSNKHLKDNRISMDYAFDLICGWIVEECLIKFFKIKGYDIELYGGDKKREFLPYTLADPDFVLKNKNNNILIELITNYVGTWKREYNIALRDSKYNKLVNNNVFILGIDFKNQKFLFINPKDFDVHKVDYFIPWGKPASLLQIDDDIFKDISSLDNAFRMLK